MLVIGINTTGASPELYLLNYEITEVFDASRDDRSDAAEELINGGDFVLGSP